MQIIANTFIVLMCIYYIVELYKVWIVINQKWDAEEKAKRLMSLIIDLNRMSSQYLQHAREEFKPLAKDVFKMTLNCLEEEGEIK